MHSILCVVRLKASFLHSLCKIFPIILTINGAIWRAFFIYFDFRMIVFAFVSSQKYFLSH